MNGRSVSICAPLAGPMCFMRSNCSIEAEFTFTCPASQPLLLGGGSGVAVGIGVAVGGGSGVAVGIGVAVGGGSGVAVGMGVAVGGVGGVVVGIGVAIGGGSGVDVGIGVAGGVRDNASALVGGGGKGGWKWAAKPEQIGPEA